jgi:hypothetical protein
MRGIKTAGPQSRCFLFLFFIYELIVFVVGKRVYNPAVPFDLQPGIEHGMDNAIIVVGERQPVLHRVFEICFNDSRFFAFASDSPTMPSSDTDLRKL